MISHCFKFYNYSFENPLCKIFFIKFIIILSNYFSFAHLMIICPHSHCHFLVLLSSRHWTKVETIQKTLITTKPTPKINTASKIALGLKLASILKSPLLIILWKAVLKTLLFLFLLYYMIYNFFYLHFFNLVLKKKVQYDQFMYKPTELL